MANAGKRGQDMLEHDEVWKRWKVQNTNETQDHEAKAGLFGDYVDLRMG